MGLLEFLRGLLGKPGKKAKKKKKKRKPGTGQAFRKSSAPGSAARPRSSQFAKRPPTAETVPRPRAGSGLADSSDGGSVRPPERAVDPGELAEVIADAEGVYEPVGAAAEKESKERKGGLFGFGEKRREVRGQSSLLRELEPSIQRGDVIGVKLKLDDASAVPAAYRLAAEEKAKNLGAARTNLKNLAEEANYQAIALAAASLAGDAGFLGDPMVKKAGEVVDLLPFVLKAAKSKKNEALGLVNDFEKILGEFKELLDGKSAYLGRVGDEIMKTLAKKDFAKLTGLAEAIVRDAEILGHQFDAGAPATAGSEDQSVAATGTQEKWKDIDKQVLQLSQVLLAKQYRFASDLAKIVAASAGVMGDPTFQKAVDLIKGGKQILAAFREQKVALVAKMSGNLSRQGGVFNAPLMARTNQLTEQIAQMEKLQKDKEYDKLANLAMSLTRTAALLIDPTIKKASVLAGDLSKVEVYVKRKDFAGALNTLASSVD